MESRGQLIGHTSTEEGEETGKGEGQSLSVDAQKYNVHKESLFICAWGIMVYVISFGFLALVCPDDEERKEKEQEREEREMREAEETEESKKKRLEEDIAAACVMGGTAFVLSALSMIVSIVV